MAKNTKHLERDAENLRIRDEVLENLLYHIAGSPELQPHLIFQGGGALHFVYSSPRYSEDIDFVCPAFDSVADTVAGGLAAPAVLHGALTYDSRFAKREEDYLRVSYVPRVAQLPGARVEVRQQTAEEYGPATGKFHPLLVEHPREIYADKVIATLQRMENRGSIKPTDLFDLDYIVTNLEGEAPVEKVERKFQSYAELGGWSRMNVERVLRHVIDPKNHDDFRRTFSKTMMPDVYAAKSFKREFFDRVALHFERLRGI